MKKRQSKLIMALFFVFAMVLGIFTTGRNVQAVSGDYLLKPAGSSTDNVNIDAGNYSITGAPGQKVDLKLLVVNKEDKARKFLYTINTAYTNDNGQLAYDKSKVTDPSLKIQTRDAVTPKKAVFGVPANTTATITFSVTVPKKAYKGTLMGAVSVAPYGEKAKGTVSSNGTVIKNKFSYSVPIQIHQTNADSQEAKYSINTVKPGTVQASDGAKPGVLANIHNSANSYTGGLSSKAIVTQKGNKKFKITENKSAQNIAPTSNYNYSISWGKKPLQAGDYHLKLTYKTAGGLKS